MNWLFKKSQGEFEAGSGLREKETGRLGRIVKQFSGNYIVELYPAEGFRYETLSVPETEMSERFEKSTIAESAVIFGQEDLSSYVMAGVLTCGSCGHTVFRHSAFYPEWSHTWTDQYLQALNAPCPECGAMHKKAQVRPERPTTDPGPGKKWVFNSETNVWEAADATAETVEIKAETPGYRVQDYFKQLEKSDLFAEARSYCAKDYRLYSFARNELARRGLQEEFDQLLAKQSNALRVEKELEREAKVKSTITELLKALPVQSENWITASPTDNEVRGIGEVRIGLPVRKGSLKGVVKDIVGDAYDVELEDGKRITLWKQELQPIDD